MKNEGDNDNDNDNEFDLYFSLFAVAISLLSLMFISPAAATTPPWRNWRQKP